jgi:hypothetical protein
MMSLWYYLNGIEILVGVSAIFRPEKTLEPQCHHRVTETVIFAQRRWGLSLLGFGTASVAVASYPNDDSAKQWIGRGWFLYHLGIVGLYSFLPTTTLSARSLTAKSKVAVAFHAFMTMGLGYQLLAGVS